MRSISFSGRVKSQTAGQRLKRPIDHTGMKVHITATMQPVGLTIGLPTRLHLGVFSQG
ncbi:hypothetical protein BLL52_2442 [Rhodoferax antarcticus ANT.BR]|uniref:Uncharacterized protein n=1 Tax=Rhodoferax antarcticus ANT.BR TaxID=1111071 RepID=A0A1Q8YDS5_9BURK|nr:hypothetical protein BLL52_2442 [Rhodoferax antarcticus ANT.BR]